MFCFVFRIVNIDWTDCKITSSNTKLAAGEFLVLEVMTRVGLPKRIQYKDCLPPGSPLCRSEFPSFFTYQIHICLHLIFLLLLFLFYSFVLLMRFDMVWWDGTWPALHCVIKIYRQGALVHTHTQTCLAKYWTDSYACMCVLGLTCSVWQSVRVLDSITLPPPPPSSLCPLIQLPYYCVSSLLLALAGSWIENHIQSAT